MEKCAKVKKILSRYLDQEASSADTVLIKTHLDNCPFCEKEFLELSRAKELITGKEIKALPPDYLVCRLREKIASQRQDSQEGFPWLAGMGNLSRRLIPVPVTAVLLSLALLILTSQQSTTSYSLEEDMLSGTQTTTATAAGLILGMQS